MDTFILKGSQSACRFIDREAVMVNAETSAYYSLNEIGSFVLCELLVSVRNPADIVSYLETRFGTSSQNIAGDVGELVAHLEAEGLIINGHSDLAVVSIEGADDVRTPTAYETPKLERHGELEQLILSGE
jgi:hypothetical protein